MLTEKIHQEKQRLGGLWARTKQAAGELWARVDAFCQSLYNELANSIRFVIDYVSPQVKEADETETEWIMNGAVSVLHCIPSEDPLEAYCQMSCVERLGVIEKIAASNAKLMGIQPCRFQTSDALPANVMGCYDPKTHSYTINAALIYAQPVTRETAARAIMNVVHEMFHAFQYTAMYRPREYGVPDEVAAFWRRNARNYCSFEMNPSFYYLQPLESYARYVEEGMMEWLRDPQMVQAVLARFH